MLVEPISCPIVRSSLDTATAPAEVYVKGQASSPDIYVNNWSVNPYLGVAAKSSVLTFASSDSLAAASSVRRAELSWENTCLSLVSRVAPTAGKTGHLALRTA